MSKVPNEDIEDDLYHLTVETAEQCGRLDKAMSAAFMDLSRSRIQGLIEQGQVTINGVTCESSSRKLQLNDVVELSVPPPVDATPQAENIPLDIVYEDDDVLVINKPAGLVVHPGAGNFTGTLVNALLHHCKGSLSGINGVMRPGIVHRLDKDTTGLMVAAKNDKAHKALSAQLEDRSLSRIYHALVFKVPFPSKATVDKPLARHPSNRLKMAVAHRGGKEARTHYTVIQKFGEACALVECQLESGRTHQIRVHMESIGHPLIGDPLYGPQKNGVSSALTKAGYDEKTVQEALNFPRQALHAGRLAFVHPSTGRDMEWSAPAPEDMSKLLKLLSK